MKDRKEIPLQYTWNLNDLFASQDDWEESLQEIETLCDEIVTKKGLITRGAHNLLEALTLMDSLGIKLEWAASYAKLHFDTDMSNPVYKENYEKLDNLYTRISDKLSFYEPELIQLTPETFEKYQKERPALATYSLMFEKLFKRKEHILSVSEEEILSRMNSLGSSFHKIYDDMTVNDLVFPEIDDGQGETIRTNEANYRKILNSYDRNLRKRYFKGLLGTYGSHINSLTSVINGNLKNSSLTAKTRKYSSSRQMSLAQNHIPLEVYDTLITTVRSNISLLQRYIDLRKNILGYQDIHFYDLFVPLVQNIEKTYTYEEACHTVKDALKVLGDSYNNTLAEAFSHRWIDVYPNQGKTPGAYATGVYGLHPYSLLNFTGTPDDIFTMAHELGHVMHSYYSNKNQPYVDSDYVIFTAEVASTVNEYLLYRYLLDKSETKEEKSYLLCVHLDSIRSTLFRQTFFADFEVQLHEMVQKDRPVTPQALCETYRSLYEFYHGSGFTIDKELTYEWARIPHFYNPFYVYQYATGISAAISLAKGILAEKDYPASKKREQYLAFLTKGGSDYPINLLKDAGVDMTTSEPIIAALQDFSETLDLLEKTI